MRMIRAKASHPVRQLAGKTIDWAAIEKIQGDEDYDQLEIRLTDGTTFKLRSRDADGYQSWLFEPEPET